MNYRQTPRIVFQPKTAQGLRRGINQIADAVRPTLGPLPRLVAVSRADSDKAPELLDNGGMIARRIIALGDRDADMGAMLMRQMIWRVYERVGDGTATAAVLFQFICNEGLRYLAADYNAMLLRNHLVEGLEVILEQLTRMAAPVGGKTRLTQVAESICHDPPLAETLGEIFDLIGEHGQFDMRSSRRRELERQYVEGAYWSGGVFDRGMIVDRRQLRTEMQEAAILISDFEIEDPALLRDVLTGAYEAGIRSLVIVARTLSENAAALLLSASQTPEKFLAIAVKIAGATATDQMEAIQDLGILTGGQPLIQTAGESLSSFTPERLGKARRAWADADRFGIVGGKGEARALRAYVADLRAAFERAADKDDRGRLRGRIGRLLGGSVILWVGGATEAEMGARKEVVGRTAEAMRNVVKEGIVPGGGIALLNCQPALRQRLKQTDEARGEASLEARAAYRILSKALEAPLRTILANAGCEASPILAEIESAGPGCGFDVRCGKVVDMKQAGIWDAAAVLKAAVHSAVSGAALALTTDVLVHHKRLMVSFQP